MKKSVHLARAWMAWEPERRAWRYSTEWYDARFGENVLRVTIPFLVLQATLSFCWSSVSPCVFSSLSLPVTLSGRIKICPNRRDADSLLQHRPRTQFITLSHNASHLHFKRHLTVSRTLLTVTSSSTGCDTFTSTPPPAPEARCHVAFCTLRQKALIWHSCSVR